MLSVRAAENLVETGANFFFAPSRRRMREKRPACPRARQTGGNDSSRHFTTFYSDNLAWPFGCARFFCVLASNALQCIQGRSLTVHASPRVRLPALRNRFQSLVRLFFDPVVKRLPFVNLVHQSLVAIRRTAGCCQRIIAFGQLSFDQTGYKTRSLTSGCRSLSMTYDFNGGQSEKKCRNVQAFQIGAME